MRTQWFRLSKASLAAGMVIAVVTASIGAAGPAKTPPPIPLSISFTYGDAVSCDNPSLGNRVLNDVPVPYVNGFEQVTATLDQTSTGQSVTFDTNGPKGPRRVMLDFCGYPNLNGLVTADADVYAFLFRTASASADDLLLKMGLGVHAQRRFYFYWPQSPNPTYRLGWYGDSRSGLVDVTCTAVTDSNTCSAWSVTPVGLAVLEKLAKGVATELGTIDMPFTMTIKVR